MKLRIIISLSLFLSIFCIPNQEKVIQCLKLKIQYPNVEINCEELLNANIDSSLSNNLNQVTDTTTFQSNPTNKLSTEFTKLINPNRTNNINTKFINNEIDSFKNDKNLQSDDSHDLQSILIKEMRNKMKINNNKLEKIQNIVQAIIKSISIVSTEINSLKSSYENDNIELEKKMKNLKNKHYQSNSNMRSHLKINKKQYFNSNIKDDLHSKLEMLYSKKRAMENNKLLSKQNTIQPRPQMIPSPNMNMLTTNSNNYNINMLQNMLSNQVDQSNILKQTNFNNDLNISVNSNQKPNPTPNRNLSLEDINSLLTNEETNKKEKTIRETNGSVEQKKNNILDSEAIKLYDSFSGLKKQQKGFLSNLMNKEVNTQGNNNMSSIINNKKVNSNNSFMNNISQLPILNDLNIKNDNSQTVTNTDSTLSEIEKQIRLLSSMNANSK